MKTKHSLVIRPDRGCQPTVLSISLFSAAMTMQYGHTMERMVNQNERIVQASTWPWLSVGMQNGDVTGRRLFKIVLIKNAVGPAKIGYARVGYLLEHRVTLAATGGQRRGKPARKTLERHGSVKLDHINIRRSID